MFVVGVYHALAGPQASLHNEILLRTMSGDLPTSRAVFAAVPGRSRFGRGARTRPGISSERNTHHREVPGVSSAVVSQR